MVADVAVVVEEERWGTWEELLLGGAVLRHGTKDWDFVASELRARTHFTFTPEVCKAKFEDLQRRYSNSTAWFEELRKQRIAELKRALEMSEDSIGSLESKLETLKAEGKDECQVDYDSSQTESHVPLPKSDRIYSSSKETSKDGISAGSYTQHTGTNCLCEPQIPSSSPVEAVEIKQEVSTSPEQEKVPDVGKLEGTIFIGQGVFVKRRRGKRKRKDCSTDVKEGSVGESELLEPAEGLSATQCKDNSASSSGQTARCFGLDDQGKSSSQETTDLLEIFESIVENKCACVFRKPLDSQKRGRYKKMILQHMDLDTIRSRIDSRSVTSIKQLFRDLLLLANNALVFYSKNTREYKSALVLRELVTKSLRQYLKNYISSSTITLLSTSSFLLSTPVKLSSTCASNRKLLGKDSKSGTAVTKTPNAANNQSSSHASLATESLAATKKGPQQPRKPGRVNATPYPGTATRGRKRSRGK